MNYPNGMKRKHVVTSSNESFSNRGMSLEEDINLTNAYYLERNIAIIHKKPTPVQIVNVNYPRRSAAVITEAYFQQASTTDYNGLYKHKHIDFEAKQTKNKTSFPLANFHEHQVHHMESIVKHGGICFIIIRFTRYRETYLLPATYLIDFWYAQHNGGRKSIPYNEIKKNGQLIPFKYQARVDYLEVVEMLYF